jgi:hypothetical protein
MANMTENSALENLIQKAIVKINGENEKSLCHFIPVKSGGYMHHFTLKKMKQKSPEILYDLIQTHIIQTASPKEIEAKPPNQIPTYRKNRLFIITEIEMDRIVTLARQTQDIELLEILQIKQAFYPDNEDFAYASAENELFSEPLIDYLKNQGWIVMESEPDIAVLRKPFVYGEEEVVLPRDRTYADYRQRVLEAIQYVAQCEHISEKAILEEVFL